MLLVDLWNTGILSVHCCVPWCWFCSLVWELLWGKSISESPVVMEMADPPAMVNRLGVNATAGTCPSPALASSVADTHVFYDNADSVSSTLVTKDLCMCSGNLQPWSVLYFHLSRRILVMPGLE